MSRTETASARRPVPRRAAFVLYALTTVCASACGNADDDSQAAPLGQQAAAQVPTEVRGGQVREVPSPWPAGACDAVYEFRAHGPDGVDAPFRVPVGGEYHPQIYFDAPWGDEPAQVVAWRPLTDNAKVLHHWIVWQGQANLMGWAPGGKGVPNPTEFGTELPTGKESLRLDMHYYNLTGTADELDRSGVVMCVVKGKNLRTKIAAVHGGFNIFSPLMVPANTKGYDLKGSCTVKASQPATIMSVAPHAHTRARHMKLTVTKPDGRQVVLHDEGFSFYDQVGYPLDPPFILEDGDKVDVLCRYDNDSNKNIGWGESTEDEMCIHWANYHPKGAFTCGPISFFPTRPTLPAAR